MASEEDQLLGFPEQKKGSKGFSKKSKRDKNQAAEPEKLEFKAEGTGKPLLYENDQGGLSPWNKGDTTIALHQPISEIEGDGAIIDLSRSDALQKYNASQSVILRV